MHKKNLLAYLKVAAGLAILSTCVAGAQQESSPSTPESSVHLQNSVLWFQRGICGMARKEAKAAVAAEPGSAIASRTLAYVLEHDLLCRRFGLGSDAAGSEAQFQRAVHLVPADPTTHVMYADFLEYDSNGIHFGPGARLSRAIDEYGAAGTTTSSAWYDNYLMALFRSGQHEKVVDELRRAPESTLHDALNIITNIKLAAFSSCTFNDRNSSDPRWPELTIRTAGALLVQTREYGAASQMLRCAGLNGETIEQLSHTVPFQVPDLRSNPIAPVLAYAAESTSDRFPQETRLEPFTLEQRQFDPTKTDRMKKIGRHQRLEMEAEGLSDSYKTDVLASHLTCDTDGDEIMGFRLTCTAPLMSQDTFWVRKEAGEYRIICFGTVPWTLGYQVLQLLDAGEVEKARQVLKWARTAMPPDSSREPWDDYPFPNVWPADGRGGVVEMARAAAALAALGPGSGRTLPILEEAYQNTKDEKVKLSFAAALARVYKKEHHFSDLERIAKVLAQADPKSIAAFEYLADAYINQDKCSLVDGLAKAYLTGQRDDLFVTRKLIYCDIVRGDFKGAAERYRPEVEKHKGTADDFNSLGWLLIFTDKPKEAIPYIEEAISRRAEGGFLHSLATAHAESGNEAEARNQLMKAMDAWGLDEPNDDIWYVYGRMAEQWGAVKEAAEAYKRINFPDPANPQSSYWLAKRRLEQIAQKPPIDPKGSLP